MPRKHPARKPADVRPPVFDVICVNYRYRYSGNTFGQNNIGFLRLYNRLFIYRAGKTFDTGDKSGTQLGKPHNQYRVLAKTAAVDLFLRRKPVGHQDSLILHTRLSYCVHRHARQRDY